MAFPPDASRGRLVLVLTEAKSYKKAGANLVDARTAILPHPRPPHAFISKTRSNLQDVRRHFPLS
ncbi:hypothetical protein BOTBODRAFT_26944 [Botryobasidium botryosum FD-172 SS1]|uniref:Uncharacterized protein n=1 Tax=Botryobasidium botryosum (strain FD-172 SS1) TaxID=930990 RepID=A0A067MYW5_BOTB1|nr:hypothetical protein BOTBODRAFT_26944 [Botryobasidium botryosum FD-172 SS1]